MSINLKILNIFNFIWVLIDFILFKNRSTETASEDDNFGTEKSFKAILIALGEERRNRVLSGLYMGRMDVSFIFYVIFIGKN